MNKELKPCPFCGSKAHWEYRRHRGFFAICENSCNHGFQIGTDECDSPLIEEWNNRPIEEELQKQAERTLQEKSAPKMYAMLERILDYMTGGPFLVKPPSVLEIAHLLEKAGGGK